MIFKCAAWCLMLCLLVLAQGCVGSRHTTNGPDACEIAQRYIDAANRSDPALIAPLLHEDVAAIFLSESDHAETIAGRSGVLEAVRTYKEHCPSCSSSMVCHLQTPFAAYVTETVEFEDASGVRRQGAPLVLEIDAQRIIHIIYFPSGQSPP